MRFLLLAAPCLAVTPVQKVVEMLNGMVAHGKQEKHEEEVRFAEFSEWCQNTSADKKNAIETAGRQIEQLSADIEKAKSDAQVLGQEIAALDKQNDGWSKDKKDAEDIRAAEHKDHTALMTDYSESIDALNRAIAVLQQQTPDVKQAALIQVNLKTLQSSKLIPATVKSTLAVFLQDDGDFLSRSAPKANAYENQSGGVIEMLKGLLKKFVAEKRDFQKEEANRKHASEMLVQELNQQIDAATNERTQKQALKGKREERAAEATGDRADTQNTMNEDTKYRKDLILECKQKSFDYENRQVLRKEELVALNKAIEVLTSGDVAGAADKHLPALVSTSFVQTFMGTEPSRKEKVAAFLSSQALKTNSQILSLVASKVSDDPFVKVKKMIRDMITRLMEEANAEASHHGFCQTELAANKQTRDQKTEEVEKLTSRADALRANIAQLANQISNLQTAIAESDKAVREATAQRQEEKAKNEATLKDAVAAQQAVNRALQVLREFYEKASGASSLIQGAADDAPATFGDAYQGQQGSSKGVVGMIEVIASDFARLESETQTAEDQAADDYKRFMNDSAEDKAVKEAEVKHKSNKKQRKEADLVSTNNDLAGNKEELAAANDYYDKLKPSCVDAGVSHEERVARREEEIESLKEALEILSGEDIA